MGFIQCQLKSNVLNMSVSVNVIYPEHVTNHKHVKVLYLLHGYTGHYMDWMRQTSIERYANAYQLCVVMPSAHNSYYTNSTSGVDYFDFIALELPEIIENMFHVSKKKEDRFIAGLSMGGYGALKIGLTFPNRFDKIACLSGALDIDRLYLELKDHPKNDRFTTVFGAMPVKGTKHDIYHLLSKLDRSKKVPEIFIACGTDDQFYKDYLDLETYLKENDFIFVKREAQGGHEWRLWDKFIEEVLSWMFSEQKTI